MNQENLATTANTGEQDAFPPQGISRLDKVRLLTGLSKSTIYAWVKLGKFPKPIKLSPTVTAWRNRDLLDWVNNLESADELHASPANAVQ